MVRLHAVRHYFPRAEKTLWRGWQGVVRKYRPDFIIRLVNDLNLVLEVKGQETEQDKAKRKSMEEWVRPLITTAALVNGPLLFREIRVM